MFGETYSDVVMVGDVYELEWENSEIVIDSSFVLVISHHTVPLLDDRFRVIPGRPLVMVVDACESSLTLLVEGSVYQCSKEILRLFFRRVT
jgi:hypothetical protein